MGGTHLQSEQTPEELRQADLMTKPSPGYIAKETNKKHVSKQTRSRSRKEGRSGRRKEEESK